MANHELRARLERCLDLAACRLAHAVRTEWHTLPESDPEVRATRAGTLPLSRDLLRQAVRSMYGAALVEGLLADACLATASAGPGSADGSAAACTFLSAGRIGGDEAERAGLVLVEVLGTDCLSASPGLAKDVAWQCLATLMAMFGTLLPTDYTFYCLELDFGGGERPPAPPSGLDELVSGLPDLGEAIEEFMRPAAADADAQYTGS